MTERTPLYLVLLAASVLVGLALLREPLFGPYLALGRTITESRAKVASLQAELRAAEQTRPELRRLGEWFGEPLAAGERPARAGVFYSRLETLAAGAGLAVESLQPRPDTVDGQGVVRFPVALNLLGDTRGLVALLSQLRASTQLVGVERITVRRRDDSARPLSMQAVLVSYGLVDRETRAKLKHAATKKAVAEAKR
jgi:hypothetical protein